MTQHPTPSVRFFFLGMVLFFCVPSRAAVKLPALFSDHMVLQQKTKVPVWGWAAPGEEVLVIAPWQIKTIRAKADSSGRWKIFLPTPQAGGPYDLKIRGHNSVDLKDVLIGEVWFCSGQSNMTFPLKYSSEAKEEIAGANYPFIRYFGVKRQYGPEPLEDCAGSAWEKTSPETASSFSAVAYYFAKRMHQERKVPVGIVCAGWSGTPAEAWTPKEVLQQDDSLQFFLHRWKDIPQKVGTDSVQYQRAVADWEKNVSNNKAAQKPDEPRTYYYYQRPWCEPGTLFNGMVNPVIPFAVKGVLWYQGESNVSEANQYEHLFTALIKSWRRQWCGEGVQKQLPFYFVQIAPFDYSNLDAAARLRQAQYQVMKKVEHTGMAVTIDLGDMKNIHFTRKKEAGERLALIALARSYGGKQMLYEGPVCTKVSPVQNKLELRFDQPLSTKGQEQLQGFEIGYKYLAGDSVVFVKAQSMLEGNKVLVWSDEVKNPLAVRYAWLEAGAANLVNKAGLPAYPFQQKVEDRHLSGNENKF
jgi:sialate O-acetylesterase